jgi:hypothetical protein
LLSESAIRTRYQTQAEGGRPSIRTRWLVVSNGVGAESPSAGVAPKYTLPLDRSLAVHMTNAWTPAADRAGRSRGVMPTVESSTAGRPEPVALFGLNTRSVVSAVARRS